MSLSQVYMSDPRLDFNIYGSKIMAASTFESKRTTAEHHHCSVQRRTLHTIPKYNYELPIAWSKGAKPVARGIERTRLMHNKWRQDVDYPQFTKRLNNETLKYGTRGRLEVVVTGTPAPEVQWRKDSRPVYESDRVNIRRVNPTTYVLVIQNASAEEQGLYSVQATNLAGSSTTSAYVHVEKYNSIYKPIRTSALDRLRHKDAKAYE